MDALWWSLSRCGDGDGSGSDVWSVHWDLPVSALIAEEARDSDATDTGLVRLRASFSGGLTSLLRHFDTVGWVIDLKNVITLRKRQRASV